MIGLMVLLALGVYLAISAMVVWLSASWAKKRGRRGWVWGGVAAFVMYNLVFWDWIPTVATHQYYCAKDSGFWVYKTVDQWKAENPGVLERLVSNSKPILKTVYAGNNYTTTVILNSRFNWIVGKTGPFLVNRHQWIQELVDTQNGEVLARYVDFSSGNGNIGGEPPIKFWLQSGHCIDGERNQSLMRQFRNHFVGAKK